MSWEVPIMRSMTLSCDRALMRADWRRLWPLAFGYAVFWLCVLPLALWSQCRDMSVGEGFVRLYGLRQVNNHLFGCTEAAVIVSACFAVLLAMALFAYLMNGRSVGLMHALPIRRGRQFYVHFSVGVQMFTAVHVLTAAIVLLVQAGSGLVCLRSTMEWLAVAEITCLFFFALASLCAMVTGWLLALPVIYAGVNFMFAAFHLLSCAMLDLYSWGVDGMSWPAWIDWLTPVVRIFVRVNDSKEVLLGTAEGREIYLDCLSSTAWWTLLAYTLVAVALVALAYFFYRLRHSETAGDAVVFSWLHPIVLYVISAAGGMGLGMLLWMLLGYYSSNGNAVILFFCEVFTGLLVYFAVRMLLQKSFKVFDRRGWLGAAALAVLLLAVTLCVRFDLFGVERYVPKADNVRYVYTYAYGLIDSGKVAESEQIEKITAIHKAIVEQGESDDALVDRVMNGADPNAVYLSINLNYTMKSGADVNRYYDVVVQRGTPLYDALNALYQDETYRQESVANAYAYVDETKDEITGGWVEVWNLPAPSVDGVVATEEATSASDQLTKAQAQRIYEALQQYARRKAAEKQDVITALKSDTGMASVGLDIYTKEKPTAAGSGYIDTTDSGSVYIGDIPCDCTEVLELLAEFGFAPSVAAMTR